MIQPLRIAPRLEVDQESLERGLLVVGDTFSDAAARMVLPLARRLVESGQTGLVLDATGEIAPRLRALYPTAVVVCGPAGAMRLNLLAGIPDVDFEDVIDAERRTYYAGREPYWGSVVKNDTALLRQFISVLERRPITLIDLYRLASSEQYVRNITQRLRVKSNGAYELIRDQPAYSAWRRDDGGQSMRDNVAWHYSFLRSLLDSVVKSPALLRAFCSKGRSPKIDVRKHVVVLDMPRAYWGKSVDFIAQLLAKWYVRRNPGGFLVTSGLASVHAAERLGLAPVVAEVDDVDDRSSSRFGSTLFFATMRPNVIEWLGAVAGEGVARGLASSARPGAGFALFRFAPSTAGLVTQGEFVAERDPFFAASSIFLCPAKHRALAMRTRELAALVEDRTIEDLF